MLKYSRNPVLVKNNEDYAFHTEIAPDVVLIVVWMVWVDCLMAQMRQEL